MGMTSCASIRENKNSYFLTNGFLAFELNKFTIRNVSHFMRKAIAKIRSKIKPNKSRGATKIDARSVQNSSHRDILGCLFWINRQLLDQYDKTKSQID